jgi:mannose-6-phosphate isomerase-like protein (cupin superfamily)
MTLDITKIDISEGGEPGCLRLNPLKTDKVAFNVYNFQPWQALSMHKHPDSDEVFYVIEGSCLIFADGERKKVEANHAAYVPSGTVHAILSCGQPSMIISVQGPTPIYSIYGKGLEYFCPRCGLETPLETDANSGEITRCPRCRTTLKLTAAGEAFTAEIIEGQVTKEAPA